MPDAGRLDLRDPRHEVGRGRDRHLPGNVPSSSAATRTSSHPGGGAHHDLEQRGCRAAGSASTTPSIVSAGSSSSDATIGPRPGHRHRRVVDDDPRLARTEGVGQRLQRQPRRLLQQAQGGAALHEHVMQRGRAGRVRPAARRTQQRTSTPSTTTNGSGRPWRTHSTSATPATQWAEQRTDLQLITELATGAAHATPTGEEPAGAVDRELNGDSPNRIGPLRWMRSVMASAAAFRSGASGRLSRWRRAHRAGRTAAGTHPRPSRRWRRHRGPRSNATGVRIGVVSMPSGTGWNHVSRATHT